ncbi:MAG: protein kinase, partial [archaeon]|nr:protein kinase [archaeon]
RWKRFHGESPLEIARNRYHSGLVSLLSNPTRPPLSPLIAASLTTLNRVKLMVVGRAAVGKTTLVRTLFGKQLDASIPSTDGIDLGLFRAGGIEFMIWDFGGQKVYRYTHQLFLSSHAVYLVLFKVSDPVSESLKEVRFWLNSISARIPNSVVLLVGTHADKTDARVAQRRATELSQTIVRENPSLLHAGQQVHLISAYAAAQPAFKGLLEAIIVAGKSMKFPAPKYFASALLSLNGLSLSPPVIELRHAIACLQEVGNSEFQILKLLDAFHILGLILVFRNEELHSRGVIVLRPQWIARLMATIVTTRHNFVSRDSGVLLHSVLVNQLWTSHDDFPPEHHRNLVDLLVQLDIFFPVGHTEEDKGYFVPCMLREEALDVGFYLPCQLSDAALQLHRVMELECAVPISVIPPIMVELMGCGEMRARWQQGCVVQIPASQPGVDDTVWLQVWRSGGRKIELKMWGESTQTVTQWLQRVCSRIDGRLKEFYHVGYRTLIPCRGCLSNDSSSDGHFDLLQLRAEVLQSHTEASCQPDERHNFRLDVMVPDLLFLDLSSPGFVLPFESLEEICELGQGAFGKVLKMTAPVHKVRNSQRPSTSTFPSGSSRPMADDQSAPSTPSSTPPTPTAEPTVVAVKFIGEVKRTKQRSVGNFFQEFKHEVYLMSSLEDPNLVKLIGICLPPKLAMVMEVVEGGDLCGQLHDPFRLKSPVFGLAESISAAFSNFNMNMTFRYVFLNRHKLTGPDREQLEGRIVGLMAKPRADAIGWIQEQFDQNSRASDFIRLTNANPVTDLRVTARQLEQLGVPRPPVLETLGDGALEKARRAFREWKASVNMCGASGLVGHIESWEHRFFEGVEELAGMWSADASFNDFKRMGQKMKEIEDGIERLSRDQSVMVAPVDEALRLKLAIDIARGMVCLHELNPPIVHRDLKTPNVFLTRSLVDFPSLESGDESWGTPLAKVGDFGLSLLGLQSQFFQIRNREEDDPLLNFNATWAAPELLSGGKYSTPVDVYSMGIVLWELLLRQYPFQGISIPRIATEVIAGRRPAVPAAMAKDPNLREYSALMMRCWHQKPARRPSMREVYDSLRNICQARCPILAAKLMPPPAPREVVSRRNHDSHEQETAPVVTLHTFAAPVSSRAQTPQVACMLAPLKQQEVLWLGLESGHLAMVDCQLGEPQRQVLHWIQCCNCDRHQQRVTAISHLCRNSDDEGTIWTGSEDGSIHVWSPQLQSLEEIYDANTLKGRLKYRSRRFFIERVVDCWMECEHGALTWFEKRHDRTPTRVLPLKSIRSVFMADPHTLSLVDSSGKTHEFLQPEDDQGYCGVTEWHRVPNNIMSLRASSPRGITRLAGQRQSQQAI